MSARHDSLLVDIGNSRLKWALTRAANVRRRGAVPLEELDEGAWERLWGDFPAPQRVAIAAVAGRAVQESLCRWVQEAWGIPARVLHSRAQACGVRNGYREPARLGVDRWAALVGAFSAVEKGPICVVDCGSAVTVDALDSGGRHLGGWLLPGVRLMHDALLRGTAGVRVEAPAAVPAEPWGRATEECVAIGTARALAATIDRARRVVAEGSDAPATVLVTGGDGSLLLPLLDGAARFDPDLVFKGMMRLLDAAPSDPP